MFVACEQAPPYVLAGFLKRSDAARNAPARCGCRALFDAQKEPREDAATALKETATRLQRAWRCPAAGHKPPAQGTHGLPRVEPDEAITDEERADCADLADDLRRWTGTPVATCPWWHASDPEILEAGRVHLWRSEPGGLAMFEGVLDPAMLEKLEALDEGACRAFEVDCDLRKAKAAK